LARRDDVAFYQAVRAAVPKGGGDGRPPPGYLDHAVRQIVAGAIVSEEVIDIFDAVGLEKPDISILSEEFLADVKTLPQKNLAVELLKKLLADEIKTRSRRNLVESRAFSEMLEQSLRKYQNRAIETAAVIEELIQLAKELREARDRGVRLGLTEDELAFYDALETNDSAVQVLGDDALRTIARELVMTVRRNTTIDWAEKESVRAKLRLMVKRVLRRYGYPPDKQELATRTVLEQAEQLSVMWGVEPPQEPSDEVEGEAISPPTLRAVAESRAVVDSEQSQDPTD
jgi:type I restriction enzyme R subunit